MRHNIRLVTAFAVVTVVVAWIALMVSYWLPDPAGKALMATAFAMGIPAIIVGGICFIGETEITEELEKRSDAKTARARPMRCTDCGSKILNAAGTTIGDQIEDEVMMLDTPAYRDEKGNWHPPTGPSNDPVRRTP